MALIGTIRKNGWILVSVLAVSLLAFILQTYAENRSNYSAGDANSYGRVDGASIDRGKFEAYQKNVYGNAQADPFQVRAQVFNHFVDEALVKKVAEENGFGVTKEELMDLQFGTTNLSPVITQRFAGEGGMVNFQQLAQIKQAIESKQLPAQYREYWAIQEDEIIQDRLQSKYSNALAKAVYTPKWQAEMGFNENNQRSSFTYVRVPFDKIPEAEVKPTDADYSAYLEKNKEQFWQAEESRTIDYITINVIASAADTASSRAELEKKTAGWATATNDSAYVAANGGDYSSAFKSKTELGALGEQLASAATGTLVGPMVVDGNITMAKVLSRKAVPDSVKARHILIKDGNAEAKVDSLLDVIKSGKATFEALAGQFGTDGQKIKVATLAGLVQALWFKNLTMLLLTS